MIIFYEERICYLSPNFIVTTLPTTCMGPLTYCSVLFAQIFQMRPMRPFHFTTLGPTEMRCWLSGFTMLSDFCLLMIHVANSCYLTYSLYFTYSRYFHLNRWSLFMLPFRKNLCHPRLFLYPSFLHVLLWSLLTTDASSWNDLTTTWKHYSSSPCSSSMAMGFWARLVPGMWIWSICLKVRISLDGGVPMRLVTWFMFA